MTSPSKSGRKNFRRRPHLFGLCKKTGKIRYGSKAKANKARLSLYARKQKRGRPYLCPHCGSWHITTTPPKEKQS